MSRSRIARAVYFAAARMSEGLTPSLIARTQELMDSGSGERDAFLAARLGQMAKRGTRGDRSSRWEPLDKLAARKGIEAGAQSTQVMRKTSGSTGVPFRFPRSKEMLRHMDAVMWAAYAWHGISPGDRHGVLWGRPFQGRARIRKMLSDGVLSRKRYNAFSVTPSESISYFRRLLAFGAEWIYGYPSLTAAFAQHCMEKGLDGHRLGLKAVVVTGELLTRSNRLILSDFFGAPIVNEYGCTEVGLLGFECRAGTMHVIPGAALLESLSETGTPVLDRPAAFAVTDLYPSAYCFDRLLLGDCGVIQSPIDACQCGRTLPSISELLGRIDSWIVLPSGKLVYDAVLAYSMPPSVLQFQGHQRTKSELHVRVVARHGESVSSASIEAAIADALGNEIRVVVEAVSEIDFGKSGKLRYFIPLDAE